MLREITAFVDKYNEKSSGSRSSGKSAEKLIIINTKKENGLPVYDRIDVLDNEDKVKAWVKGNKHYGKIIRDMKEYLPAATKPESNKALGSTKGLLTYTFFVFKLSKKNLADLAKKIEKTKFQNNPDQLNDTFQAIYRSAESALVKKTENKYDYLGFYVLICVDKDTFERWHKIASDYIKQKISVGNENLTVKGGTCFVCSKENVDVYSPPFFTAYDDSKIFLKHKTMHEKKGIPAYTCTDCGKKSSEFKKILCDHKMKIFPLFVDPDKQYDEIQFLSDNLEEDQNKFSLMFEQLVERSEKNLFDFYLVVISNDYFFFDYITGYDWNVGTFTEYSGKQPYPITRHGLESKIASVLVGKKQIPYFDKSLKGMDNQEKTLIFSLRQKIFDFVYRNQNNLTSQDLQTLALFRIEKSIRTDTKPNLETFNLFYNQSLLLKNANSEDDFLNNIKEVKEKFLSNKDENFDIVSDKVWAYFAGQIAFYLISLSKTNDKKFGLLEPFTNKSTTDLVKKTIEQLFEQYRHDISLDNRRFKKLVTPIFLYSPHLSFIDLKIYFYAGACDDDNVIYHKEKGTA